MNYLDEFVDPVSLELLHDAGLDRDVGNGRLTFGLAARIDADGEGQIPHTNIGEKAFSSAMGTLRRSGTFGEDEGQVNRMAADVSRWWQLRRETVQSNPGKSMQCIGFTVSITCSHLQELDHSDFSWSTGNSTTKVAPSSGLPWAVIVPSWR